MRRQNSSLYRQSQTALGGKVLPALEAGKLVIMDRFIDSSLAIRGFGRGLDIDAIDWLNQFATDGLKPDLTLYFDIEVEEGLARIAANSNRGGQSFGLRRFGLA